MADSPTILIAALDDKQLKDSISNLVGHMKLALNTMTKDTDDAVSRMQKSLEKLGSLKIDSGGSADGGSSRRAKKQQEETQATKENTQAHKELKMTLDQEASAMKRAIGGKNGIDYVRLTSDVDPNLTYLVNANRDVDKQLEEIIQKEQRLIEQKKQEATETHAIANAQQRINSSMSGESIFGANVHDMQRTSRNILSQQSVATSISATNAEYTALEKTIANLLNIQVQELNLTTNANGAYVALNASLGQMTNAYREMTKSERDSAQGQELADKIQKTKKAMQDIQKQMNRPISLKSILDFEPKTLDDITDKIRQLNAYKQGLNFKTQGGEIKQVDAEIKRLNNDLNKYMSTSRRASEVNNIFASSWRYMKNRLAFYFTVGASSAFVKNLIEVRSQYEMNEKALGVLLNSASRGTRIFNELSQMSLVSPYTLIELSNAAKQLTAYDIAAKDVVDTTRRLADMASAVGVPVERLTYALGQIKAYGYLNARDARMFANAGIPLAKQLADYYSEIEGKLVSTADVYTKIKKKAVDYADVMKVINKMTDEGGKFFDFQAKMAETLKVRLANFTLAMNNMLNAIGKDEQGVINTSLKALTEMLKHWRYVLRVLGTIITAFGTYKVAAALAGSTGVKAASANAVAWITTARSIRSAKDAATFFSMALKSIPFVGLITAIASLVSWFVIFNKSGEDAKEKLKEISNAFDGVRNEVENLFADAIKSNNIGTQLSKLRDILDLAQTELGVTIPIDIEKVDESNVKQKLKESRDTIYTYLNFAQTFSEVAVGTRFNEEMNNFGKEARSIYTSVSESINSVIASLQNLSDSGKASKRDIEILNELIAGQKEDESRIEYLQRLISLYEELGLIGTEKLQPRTGFLAYFDSYESNMEDLEEKQNNSLNRLCLKNKDTFKTMLEDVQNYYSSSSIASYQFEKQIERVAKKINLNEMPIAERTVRLEVAINEEAAKNNWNQFEIEYARLIANQKFGTNIVISSESKDVAEGELQDWQKRQQSWMDKHGIKVKLDFQTTDTEQSYASRMLQAAKDALEEYETQKRKLKIGTGTQEDVNKAQKDYQKAYKKAEAAGADLSSLNKKNAKERAKAESELQKALKEELQLIDEVRSAYKKLTKEGVDSKKAIEVSTSGFDESVDLINNTFKKWGLEKLDLTKYAGVANPRRVLDMLEKQLNKLISSGRAKASEIKDLQVKIKDLKIDSVSFDQKTLTDSLNNELGKLKDEYELAVEFDASPELGNVFMSAMGLDEEELRKLPRTWNDVANKAQQAINRVFDENGFGKSFDLLANLDKGELEKWAKENGQDMDDALMKELVKFVEEVNKVRLDETKKTTKEWDDLIEKYGGLQHKLIKITKDSVQEQINVIKQSNDADAIKSALKLSDKISMSQDPSEIARLQNELAVIFNKVITDNPDLFKVGIGVENQELSLISESYWEDFKNSELYSEVFDDMSRKSVQSIRVIIAALDALKDKVKDDPESMKALIKSLEDATKELESRNPLNAIGDGFKKIKDGIQTVKFNRPLLKNARKELDAANKSGDQERINKAQEDYNNALAKSRLGWDRIRAGQEKVVAGLEGMKNQVSMIGDAFTSVANLFGEFGDEDTKQAIEDINKGFTIMVSTITAVIAVMLILQASSVWLLAVAAALGVIIGLVNFLSKRDNRRIDKQIEQSEYRVKKLENAYKNIQHAMDEAYGTAVIGAKQMAIANKKLQLEELKRQLQLEKSRSKKDYDKEKVLELEGQIIDLENEINDAINEIVENLLDVSSVGDAVGNLVDSIVDALRNGEDAMESFNESVDDMIVNLLKKFIMTRYIGPLVEDAFNKMNDYINSKSQGYYDELSLLKQERQKFVNLIKDAEKWRRNELFRDKADKVIADSKMQIANLDAKIAAVNKLIQGGEGLTESDIDVLVGILEDLKVQASPYYDVIKELLERYGMIKDGNKEISALQQGIQSITEDTAGAIEAYLNGISQQVYLHSDLLTQIRDAVVSFDFDTNLGVMSQILLQLQNNYIVMQSIQSMMENWTVPSGSGIRVELLS